MIRLAAITLLLLSAWFCSPRSEQPAQAPPPQAAASVGECEAASDTSKVIGFGVVSFNEKTVIPFFADSDASKQPVQVVRFYHEPATNSLSFRVEGEGSYSLLRPGGHKLDYFIFDLPVQARRDGWLEVVADQESGKTLWVREDQTIRFADWLTKMRGAFAVERFELEGNPLRSKPAEAASEVKIIGRDCFKVSEIKGDWIKVIQQDVCNGESSSSASGWVRWRDSQGCLLMWIYPFA